MTDKPYWWYTDETKLPGTTQGAVGQEAPAVTDRMELDQPCQSCTGWQRIDTLRCIRCSEWSHQNYAPLSELATCKESLRVQNVSQEDPTMLNQPKKTEAEYGWVIERCDSPVSAPLYFMAITGKKEAAWSVHHLSAVRFCRKEDAESVLPFLGSGHRVCEHGWCNI